MVISKLSTVQNACQFLSNIFRSVYLRIFNRNNDELKFGSLKKELDCFRIIEVVKFVTTFNNYNRYYTR